MKTLLLSLLAGMISFSATNPPTANSFHAITFEEPFEFVTDDGCGDFHVSGMLIVIVGREGAELFK